MFTNSRLKYKITVIFILLFLFTLGHPVVVAQNQPKGVSVTPSIAHIDLSEDNAEYSITYMNNFDSSITLNLSAKDFTQLEDNYKLDFLPENQAQTYKYSLSSWISFENKTLELTKGEKKTIKIFIDKNRITKGGHYASILAEISQPDTNKDIGIKAVISSLLFVRASTGKEIEEGKISSFEPIRNGIENPETFLLRFQNMGNVHVIPHGLIEIYDSIGNLAAKSPINENSLDTLPESIRSYTTKINTNQKVLLPGTYTAKINIRFGKANKLATYSVKYFSQGSFDFVKIGFGAILITIILLLYKKRRKNKILANS